MSRGEAMYEEHEAVDPATAPERLAQIAATRPALRVAVARHPNAYDGLLDWLAAHGGPDAAAAVAARRMPIPPRPPVPQPPAPAPSASVPASVPPRPAFPAPQAIPPRPAAPARQAVPPRPAEQPQPRPVAPSGPAEQGQPVAPPLSTGSSGFAQPQQQTARYPQQPSFPQQPLAPQRPRRRKGLLIALIAGGAAVVLVGGGLLWAGATGFFSRGAVSPEAAAAKLLEGATGNDPLALVTSLAPSEIEALTPAIKTLGDVSTEDDSDYLDLLGDLAEVSDVVVEGFAYTTTAVTDDIVVVEAQTGTITFDGDPAAIADVLIDLETDVMSGQMEAWGYDESDVTETIESQRQYLVDDLADSLPYTFDIAEQIDDAGWNPFAVVAVDEGGWYVSPLLTVGEMGLRQSAYYSDESPDGLRGTAVPAASPFASPEEAASGTTEAFAEYLRTGNADVIARVLPLPERRFVSLYGDALPWTGGEADITIQTSSFSSTRDGDTAVVSIDDLVFSVGGYDGETDVSFDGGCWRTSWSEYSGYSDESSGCLSDWGGAVPLGLDEIELSAVREDGGWLISPLATVGSLAATAAVGISDLADQGRLDELWSVD